MPRVLPTFAVEAAPLFLSMARAKEHRARLACAPPFNASSYPSVSPDGKWIAFNDYVLPSTTRIGVIPFAGGQPAARSTFGLPFCGLSHNPLDRDGRDLT